MKTFEDLVFIDQVPEEVKILPIFKDFTWFRATMRFDNGCEISVINIHMSNTKQTTARYEIAAFTNDQWFEGYPMGHMNEAMITEEMIKLQTM